MTKDKKEEIDFEEMYGKFATVKVKDFMDDQKINIEKGLSSKEVKEKIENLGYNIVSKGKEKKWYHYFLGSLFSKFNLILLGIVRVF